LVKSYFTNKEAKVLVNSVVGFSNSFGIKTVAECIETKEQAQELKNVGVTHGQGYYFYKPMPLSDLLKLNTW
jgi:EAL domain-containing protein (putative c-di-GMP-specific phosphodiesterase class I)